MQRLLKLNVLFLKQHYIVASKLTIHTSVFNALTCTCVSSQWLDGDEAEDEGVAEEGDEAGVVQGDDHRVIHWLLTTPLFVQDFFHFIRGNVL